jgi:hypothetical protein
MGFAETGLVGDDGRMDFSREANVPAALLQVKRQSLMDLAKLFGWVTEKHEDVSRLEDRLRAMTPEQRRQDAIEVFRRAKARLLEDQRQGGESGLSVKRDAHSRG